MTNYYDKNFQNFIDTTLNIDMSSLYSPFCELLPGGGKILDIGCGPGRDIKYFNEQGFSAQGIEPSQSLCEYAKIYTKSHIYFGDLDSFKTKEMFDGIWACASLLHVPSNGLKESFEKISSLLNDSGIFYCSFKYGEFEGERNGRFFNDQTSESIRQYIPNELKIISEWITEDKRPERSERWLNLILKK